MIRLEREVKDKCTKLDVFQGKFTNLEQVCLVTLLFNIIVKDTLIYTKNAQEAK